MLTSENTDLPPRAEIDTKSTRASEMIEIFPRHLDKKVAGLKGYDTTYPGF